MNPNSELQPDPDWEVQYVPTVRVEIVDGHLVITPDKYILGSRPTEARLRKLFGLNPTQNENRS